MKPDLAGKNSAQPQVLVLGSLATARPLAQQFQEKGFQVHLDEQRESVIRVPPVSTPGAWDRLKAVLTQFRDQALEGASAESLGWRPLVHSGTSSWGDRPELVALGQELGLNVLSPPTRVVNLFSNTLNLLGLADSLGIPHLVMTFDPIQSRKELDRALGTQRQFPLVLKSVTPIGAASVLVLRSEDDLRERLPLWQEQVRLETGESIAFAERYVESARHVSLPFARFHSGKMQFFPLVDGSLQIRGHRLIEFCPAPGLGETGDALLAQLHSWGQSLLGACGFVGVGSLDFMIDGQRAYFLGGLPRLGAGFQLWEKVAGTSALDWQLATFLDQPAPPQFAESPLAGVSFRLYAEDSLLQLPQPGWVHELSTQNQWKITGAQGEVSWNYRAGEVVPADGPRLLAIGSALAANHAKALLLARGMLEEIWIAGSLKTNQRYLSELMRHPWVREGLFHAAFLEEEFLPEALPSAELLQLFGSIAAWAHRGPESTGEADPGLYGLASQWVRPQLESLKWREPPRWSAGGPLAERAKVLSGFVALEEGRWLRVCAYPLSSDRWQVRLGEWTERVRRALPRSARPSGAVASPTLNALVTGKVHALLFREGAKVSAHTPLVWVSSMRAIVQHSLPRAYRIKKWLVSPEASVENGQPLAELELVEELDQLS